MLTLRPPVLLLFASLPLLGWGCGSSSDTSFDPTPGAAGSGGSAQAGASGQGGIGGSSGSGTGGASGGSGTAGGGTAGSGGGSGGSGGAASGGAGGTSGGAGTSPGGAAGAGGAGPGCVDAGPGKKRLSVVGPEIHDAKGENVVLRGWNWGEWGYTQPQDAADNAAQGATIVRIPLRWWGVYENQPPDTKPSEKVDARDDAAPGHIEPGHLKALDEMVKRAACAGLWIDLFVDSNRPCRRKWAERRRPARRPAGSEQLRTGQRRQRPGVVLRHRRERRAQELLQRPGVGEDVRGGVGVPGRALQGSAVHRLVRADARAADGLHEEAVRLGRGAGAVFAHHRPHPEDRREDAPARGRRRGV